MEKADNVEDDYSEEDEWWMKFIYYSLKYLSLLFLFSSMQLPTTHPTLVIEFFKIKKWSWPYLYFIEIKKLSATLTFYKKSLCG